MPLELNWKEVIFYLECVLSVCALLLAHKRVSSRGRGGNPNPKDFFLLSAMKVWMLYHVNYIVYCVVDFRICHGVVSEWVTLQILLILEWSIMTELSMGVLAIVLHMVQLWMLLEHAHWLGAINNWIMSNSNRVINKRMIMLVMCTLIFSLNGLIALINWEQPARGSLLISLSQLVISVLYLTICLVPLIDLWGIRLVVVNSLSNHTKNALTNACNTLIGVMSSSCIVALVNIVMQIGFLLNEKDILINGNTAEQRRDMLRIKRNSPGMDFSTMVFGLIGVILSLVTYRGKSQRQDKDKHASSNTLNLSMK